MQAIVGGSLGWGGGRRGGKRKVNNLDPISLTFITVLSWWSDNFISNLGNVPSTRALIEQKNIIIIAIIRGINANADIE